MISDNTLNVLEYNEILKLVASYAFSRPAREQILQEKPLNDLDKVKNLLDLTADADKLLYEMAVNISLAFDDISEALELAHRGVMLNPDQLLRVARAIKVDKPKPNELTLTPLPFLNPFNKKNKRTDPPTKATDETANKEIETALTALRLF